MLISRASRPGEFAPVLTKRLTLGATTLRGRSPAQKQAIRDALLREVWPQLGAGVKPVIDKIFPLDQASKPMNSWQKPAISAKSCYESRESLCAPGATPLKDRIPRRTSLTRAADPDTVPLNGRKPPWPSNKNP